MKSWQRTTLIICCLLGMIISFIWHIRTNINSLNDIKAPVHINIEIDKAHTSSISIVAGINEDNILFSLSSTQNNTVLRTTVMYAEIKGVEDINPPIIHKLSLYTPKETAHETLNAIEGISIFVGNKMFYFSPSDVSNLHGIEQYDHIFYELPNLEYRRSVIGSLLNLPPIVNWYGDFNFAIKVMFSFLTSPDRFVLTWLFMIFFLVLGYNKINKFFTGLQKQKFPFVEPFFLLSFIVITGFILRFNDSVRYSSCYDQLYSACIASNPVNPFISTFEDPGNPPLYFILLRFWFQLFGWTEQSGRLFSVFTGSATIIALYVFVKRFVNKKTAFLAALYMALSAYFINESYIIRAYMLEVFLVIIAAHRFLIILQTRNPGYVNLLWYVITSILLVNTHYYGSIFVLTTFLFFVIHSIKAKNFTWKNTVLFLLCNVLIAASLLPYFIHTAIQRALLDPNFNTWIQKPRLEYRLLAALIPIFGISYILIKKTAFSKILLDVYTCFFDYTIFVTAGVFLLAFGFSMGVRPILNSRYLIILYPFVIVSLSAVLLNVFSKSPKFIGYLCICLAYILIAIGYKGRLDRSSDVYHESQAYISKDAQAHPQNISMEILPLIDSAADFYGYNKLLQYNTGNTYDVLYYNPLHRSIERMYSDVENLGINKDRVLQIYVNESKSIFKIYSDNQSIVERGVD